MQAHFFLPLLVISKIKQDREKNILTFWNKKKERIMIKHVQAVPTLMPWWHGEYVEGYWKLSRNSQDKSFAWPVATPVSDNPHWFNMRHNFLGKLERVESRLLKYQEAINDGAGDPSVDDGVRDCVVTYRGLATCRLCKPQIMVGCLEFVIRKFSWEGRDITLRWPVGYSHYLKEHDIVPSRLFICVIEQLNKNSGIF
jgi:hypothetical protein